jgi:hypothetical protein
MIHKQKIIFSGYILLVVVFAFWPATNLSPFWDMLPYMGCVIEIDESAPELVHQRTYSEFNRYASERMKASMLDGHPFCREMQRSPEHFNQQLPFYRVKPLYIWLSYLLWKCGIPLFYAFCCVNVLAVVVLGWFAFKWLQAFFTPVYTFLLSLILVFLPMHCSTYSIASPDTLSAASLIAGAYFFLQKKKTILTLVCFLIAVLVRVDNAIFVTLILSASLIRSLQMRSRILPYVVALGILALLLFMIWEQSSGYSMQQMFYRSFVDLVVNPQAIDYNINPLMYWNGIQKGIRDSVHNIEFYLLPILILLFFIYRQQKSGEQQVWLFALIGTLLIRLLMHPLFENRYLFAYSLVFMLLLVPDVKSMLGKINRTAS